MIKVSDATLLTLSKLRSHKLRTILTILVASLVFSILVAISLIATGAFNSIEKFRQGSLTNRYIVSVYNAPPASMATLQLLRDPELISAAKNQYESLVAAKTIEAERLGINYSQAGDPPPYSITSDGTERLETHDPNGITQNLLKDRFKNEPAFDEAKLANLARKYNAVDIFRATNYTITRGATLQVFKDDKEVFYNHEDQAETDKYYQKPVVDGIQMTLAPTKLIKPFLFKDNAGWQPSDGSIPIVLPQDAVERLLGLGKLPKNATAKDKAERINTINLKTDNLAFKACYRNSASIALIQQTIQQNSDAKQNSINKDYIAPSVKYRLPDPAKCEAPTVVSDTRTALEKQANSNQEIFDRKFGSIQTLENYFVSFKVVGISPANEPLGTEQHEQATAQNLNDIINNLLSTSGIGQAIPQELYDKLPDDKKRPELFTYTPLYWFGNEDNLQRYVEFDNAKDAQRFIDEQSCAVDYDNVCKPEGRPYQASLSFSNSAAIDDLKSKIVQLFNYGMIGAAILGVIIMSLTIGRVIADGRRETAIFRAIGFKRTDIVQIYLLYGLVISIGVAIFALAIGFLSVYVIDSIYAPSLTSQAQYSFGDLTAAKRIELLAWDIKQLGLILLVCLATGIVGSIIPLLRNIRRSPLRDMRDE